MNKGISRRRFVKLAGTAIALAALPGCGVLAADDKQEQKLAKGKEKAVLVASIIFLIVNAVAQNP